MMFKDACNSKSNQRHLGTIRGSNLCTEIVEYTSEDEVAVCNLASIALPRFVLPAVAATAGGGGEGGEGGEGGAPARFDLEALHEVSRVVAKSLDRVIDRSEYPLVEARNSNLRHRPVGIGVQGLADAFALLGLPFESADAAALNRDIFETMYYAAADILVESGLRDAGYDTILVTCAGWQRDPVTHKLMENKVVWPRGYKAFIDYLHSKQLKIGAYGDTGEFNCCRMCVDGNCWQEPGQLGVGRVIGDGGHGDAAERRHRALHLEGADA